MLVVDHAIALLLTHKLNMEDKHTKSLKSMKIFFTEKEILSCSRNGKTKYCKNH